MSYQDSVWTDGDIGYLTDNMDAPVRDVAEHLGRSSNAVKLMRSKIRRGYSGPSKSVPWTDDEDSIIRGGWLSTTKELSAILPGRTVRAVSTRRAQLMGRGLAFQEKNPFCIGVRTLIAKTCRACGLLLPSAWFHAGGAKRAQSSYCRQCDGKRRDNWEKNLVGERKVERAKRANKRSRDYVEKAQEITLPLASNSGQEYTEGDHAVLADPLRSNLNKALALRRSYLAVSTAVRLNGYTSGTPKPDPHEEQWLINNPNAVRVEEITASITQQPDETHTIVRPDFEWDD